MGHRKPVLQGEGLRRFFDGRVVTRGWTQHNAECLNTAHRELSVRLFCLVILYLAPAHSQPRSLEHAYEVATAASRPFARRRPRLAKRPHGGNETYQTDQYDHRKREIAESLQPRPPDIHPIREL